MINWKRTGLACLLVAVIADDVRANDRVGSPQTGDAIQVLTDVPNGHVVVTFTEGLSTHERWPHADEELPAAKTHWLGDAMLLPRIPLRYDEWGIRDSWNAPVLVRMAVDVKLPPGNHRFLLRARGLSRLWVDGVIVARTAALTDQPPNGEEPVTPLAKPPLPGLRVHGYRMQEVFGDATIEDFPNEGAKMYRVVLETIVGGEKLRTETGETCAAIMTADGQSYSILRSAGASGLPLPLTDSAVMRALTEIETSLTNFDDETRRLAAASRDEFWNRRHEVAREWSAENPAAVPVLESGESAEHSVDTFIATKIERALREASESDSQEVELFHAQVLPILSEMCFRCHGEKDKGGLRLDSLAKAIEGGRSGMPVIVPGDAAASELIARVISDDPDERMPPTDVVLSGTQIETLKNWIQSGARWPAVPAATADLEVAARVDDHAFLRRLYLDTVGVPPTVAEMSSFINDTNSTKRDRFVEKLLADERLADNQMGFWQDLLAENPTLINASLNSSGPFRWFLYDALRDNKPLDRMVTELILLRGSTHEGGSAGFALAGENDAPFAAKGHIVASAFLGIELQCARCHDSPYNSTTQRDLFSLAAMFQREPVTVPGGSAVPAKFFENLGRKPLIQVTLKPGEPVEPRWPFADATGAREGPDIDRLMNDPSDTRERLAAFITSPQNTRFPKVVVNRIWKRLLGAGIVEPVHDWEGRAASHPALLDWLAQELVSHGYDAKHIMRLILQSETYQREAIGRNLAAVPQARFFNGPDQRKLTAEQVVDSLHATTGVPMNVEELTFVHDGRRAANERLTLGTPTRAWMLASLANERDRPSLNLPRARAVADVLEAFGWSGARQQPVVQRETEPNVLQPGVLANGTLSMTLTRAFDGSTLAQLAVDAKSPEALVDTLFLQCLGRTPSVDEQAVFVQALSDGFESRLLHPGEITTPESLPALPLVTWFNHLQSEANSIQLEVERRVQIGPPPDRRLRDEWREVYEDAVWSLINHREFVWMP